MLLQPPFRLGGYGGPGRGGVDPTVRAADGKPSASEVGRSRSRPEAGIVVLGTAAGLHIAGIFLWSAR